MRFPAAGLAIDAAAAVARAAVVLLLLTASAWGGSVDDETSASAAWARILHASDRHEAVRLARRALDESAARHGDVHPVTAFWLERTAELCETVHDGEAEVALRVRLLPVVERLEGAGSNHADVTVSRIAGLYSDLGRPFDAVPYEERLLGIVVGRRGPSHLLTARFRRDLAWLYDEVGRWSDARAQLDAALPVFEEALARPVAERGVEPTRLAEVEAVRTQLGVVCVRLGDLERAEVILRGVLERHGRQYGEDAVELRQVCTDLGLLYESMGDLVLAERYLERALGLAERASGRGSRETVVFLSNLASLRHRQGRHAEAVDLMYRAAGIVGRGRDAALTAQIEGKLGLFLLDLRRFAIAVPMLEQSLRLARERPGQATPYVAVALVNLAGAWQEAGRNDLARPLLEEAVALDRRLLGADHPATLVALNNLAWLEQESGRRGEALRLAREAARVRVAATARILALSSERQRLAWRANDRIDPYTLFDALDSPTDLAEAALRNKGLVLDSLLDDRALAASGSPRLARIRSLREQLDQLALGTPPDASPQALGRRVRQRDLLQRALDDEEGALARDGGPRRRAGAALAVTLPQVQAALPDDAVLVEYVLAARRPVGQARRPTYLGLVVGRRSVRAVRLGAADRVDEAVRDYRTAVRNPRGMSDADLERALRSLHAMVWAPIEAAFEPGVRRVYVSPDGMLDFVSLATLLDGTGRFVAERHAVRYLASGRDLVRAPAAVSSRRIVLYGDPRFGADETVAGDIRAGTPPLPRLPGSGQECAAVAAAARARGWEARVVSGADATEKALRQERAPTVLHLATHGFLLPSEAVSSNPMLRSGVALAGARATLEAWQRGETPSPRDDGLLLAAEVGDLDLRGTWLVTLSACDTGLGEVRDGEGVLGLQRGFAFAGVENLMMTLWPVPDRSTAAFMTDFYTRLLDTGRPPADVLDEVQRDWLMRLRAERGLQAAVSVAGPFVMGVRAGP